MQESDNKTTIEQRFAILESDIETNAVRITQNSASVAGLASALVDKDILKESDIKLHIELVRNQMRALEERLASQMSGDENLGKIIESIKIG